MPQLGESIAEGTVSVWLKGIGDRVERDEPILEVSTDKVDAEIPSPAAGTLAEILVPEGETVEVGTVVARIDSGAVSSVEPEVAAPSGGATEESGASAEERGGSAAPAVAEGSPASGGGVAVSADAAAAVEAKVEADGAAGTSPAGAGITVAGEAAGAPEDERQQGSAPLSAANAAEPATLEERLRTRSSPLVRRIAAENRVDLRRVRGTGRMGRVTKSDILNHIRSGISTVPDAGGGGLDWHAFHTQVEHPVVEAVTGDRVAPLSRMTRLIADHMVLSKRISPHAHSIIEIDYSRIDRLRDSRRAQWEASNAKVSYTAFITRAVASALREHPTLNASVSGDQVIYRGEVNIGVAVALPWGLIVPVVKKADELSLVGVATRIADLAERARAKRLHPAEVQGGTFTITNPGVFGTVIGFPIVNQPQVAILCVGGVEKRPVVVTDEFGNDAVVARRRGFLSLGFDHRLVNGADADRFLARVKELLESMEDAG